MTYSVSRDGKAPAGNCPTTGVPQAVTSCTDSGVAVGGHTYTVTARWHSWSATSSPVSAQIDSGPATRLILVAGSSTSGAGQADNLTITAKDAANRTVTSYTGTHNLSFAGAANSPNGTRPTVSDSSGAAINFGTATALDFSGGVATVSGSTNGAMRLYRAGTATITASDGSISTASGLAVTVSAATAASLALSAASSTPTAGAADNLTVTALDPYGNTASSYTGTHSLTFAGAKASPNGTKPTVANSSGTAVGFGGSTSISFSAGVATVSSTKNGVMRLYGAETATITAADASIATSAGAVVAVAPATTATGLSLEAASTTPTAGVADNLTARALDAYGNTASSYAGNHSLTFAGAGSGPNGDRPTVTNRTGKAINFGSSTSLTFSAGIATVSGTGNGVMRLYKAETASITASAGAISTVTPLLVTVSAAAAASLSLEASSSTSTAGAADSLTVAALGTYGNIATSYAGAHDIVFAGASESPDGTAPTVTDRSGTAVELGQATSISFSAGIASVSGAANGVIRLYRAGTATITASDGSISTSVGLPVTVEAAGPERLAFTNVKASGGTISTSCLLTCAIAGLGNSGTVIANVSVADGFGNVVTDLGSGHRVEVQSEGGSVKRGRLTIASSGAAESTKQFTFTAQSKGGFTDTISAESSRGTAYMPAIATVSN